MRVGITIWGSRVSPVADTATELLVAASDGGAWREEGRVPLGEEGVGRTAHRIADLGLDVLVCGAISRRYAAVLESDGVRVLPWVAGDWQEVLSALANGELRRDQFMMAGCARGGRGRGRGGGRGGGRGDGRDGGRGGEREGGRGAGGEDGRGRGRGDGRGGGRGRRGGGSA